MQLSTSESESSIRSGRKVSLFSLHLVDGELLNASPDPASQLLKMLQIVNGGTQNAVGIR